MSQERPGRISNNLEAGARDVQERRRTLEVPPRALEQLLAHSTEYLALVLIEADRIARQRNGDSIQTGDIDQAKEVLEGKSKGNYWYLSLGSILAGAGFQGGLDAALNNKGIPLIASYAIAFLLGLILIYMGAPRR